MKNGAKASWVFAALLLVCCGGDDTCLQMCPAGQGCDEIGECVDQTHLQVIVQSYVNVDGAIDQDFPTDALLWRGQAPNGAVIAPPVPAVTAGYCAVYSYSVWLAPTGFDEACLDLGIITARTATSSAKTIGVCNPDGYFEISELDTGALTTATSVAVESTGGDDVGSFDAQLRFPPPINATFEEPPRGMPMPVTWSARGPDNVVITGHSDGGNYFQCVVPADDGGVTVDANILSWVYGGYATQVWIESSSKVSTSTGAFVALTGRREEYFVTFY